MGTKYAGTTEERRALDTYIKLHRAAQSSMKRTSDHLDRCNLTISQFAVLEALYHLGTLSQRDLAAKLLTSTGNMTTVLKNLEREELVQRVRDSLDNRFMRVDITAKGRQLIEQILPEHVYGIVEEMSVLTAAEQEELARLTRKLGLQERK
ncbi:MAG TPA: MarR family transcriptional regulator [Aggregatilineaceae bacterium]|nr:MarR family transcriptional regulator [Aggregatilineaceae bacterium]